MGIVVVLGASFALFVCVLVWKIVDDERVPGLIIPLMLVPVANLFILLMVLATRPQHEEANAKRPRKGVIYTESELKQFRDGYKATD